VNIVGSRWTYQLKHNANGDILHYKARLVTQGFTQATRVDYDATFAPVARFELNRVVLAIAAYNDWEIHQIDVKNTYLNVELTEMIYMKQPPGFTPPGSEGQVCQLFKALYGLKQADTAGITGSAKCSASSCICGVHQSTACSTNT